MHRILKGRQETRGYPGDSTRQLGDLVHAFADVASLQGNIEADGSGTARYAATDGLLRLHGHRSVLGRSVVIREYSDDCVTQPDGKSGDVLAHGVVVIGE